ncbi:MAG: autotransporter-associated beta strand repeat-containing protein [Verrucomicrobiota bacterium]
MKFSPVCLTFLATASIAFCETFTWTGATDGNWNTPANWTTGIPISADTTALVFDNTSSPAVTNNLPAGLTLNSLTIGAASGARTFSGNLLTFAGTLPSITKQNAAGNVTLGANVQLNASLRLIAPNPFTSQIGISGIVSGSGGVIADEGISVLSGANTYSGSTVVRDGALLGVVGSGVAATSGISVETGGEFQLLKDTFIGRPITLSGGLTSAGKQNVVSIFTAPSVGYSGAITLAGNSEIRAFGGNNSSVFNRVVFPISGPIALAGNDLIASTSGSGNTLQFSNTLSGLGNLEISASGGIISFEGLNVNGTVSVTGSGSTPTVDTLAGDGLLEIDTEQLFDGLIVTGEVTGNRNISLISGDLELNSILNTFTGAIGIADGTLTGQTQASLGNPANPIHFTNGGLLSLTSSGDLGHPITTTGGGGFSSPGFSGIISSNISGSGGFAFFNFGRNAIYTLTGNNTFEGGLGIGTGAIIVFSQDSNLGAAGGTLEFSGGSLSLPADFSTLSRPIELNGGSIGGNVGVTHEITGNISGAGRLSLGGGATFVLSGSSDFTGQLAAIGQNSGPPTTLVVSDDSKLGAPSATIQLGEQSGNFFRPGQLRATGNLNIAATRSTTFRAATIDTNGFNVTFNQPFSGRGLTKTGAGILRLNTANSDSSNDNDITISQGILRLGINHAFGSRARIASMTDDAVFDLNGFAAEFGSIENVAASSEIRLGTGELTIRTAANIGGSITGPGSVVIGQSGYSAFTSIFSGVNTFSGGLTIRNGGTLVLQNPASLGAPGNSITLDDGTLSAGSMLDFPLVIDSSMNLNIGPGGARFQVDNQSMIIERQLTGTDPIRFGGGSGVYDSEIYDVRLVNPANDFTGPVQIGEADFQRRSSDIIGIVANGSLGNPANIVTLGASFYDGESTHSRSGGLRAYADLTIPAARTIQLQGEGGVIDSNGHVFTIASAISELSPEKTLLKNGAGTLVLNRANTYTGETYIRQGTLGGNGSIIGRLRFDSETVLAPGAPSAIGTFTCIDFDMTSGGTYAVNLASGSGADRLVANGEVSISESAALLIQPIGPVTQGDVFIILQKSGETPISGTFQQTAPFTSGGVQWSINYSGGDGNDIALTALTSSTPVAALPVLSNLSITPAGPGSLASISATITGGVPDTSIFLEASSDLGQLDAWETLQAIPLDATGSANLTSFADVNSSGLSRNFFRLRVP